MRWRPIWTAGVNYVYLPQTDGIHGRMPGCCGDVFDQLARSERMLNARELASILAISPKTLYS
jgi:hypothetical protein